MTPKELYAIKQEKVNKVKYKMLHHSDFDYTILNDIMYLIPAGSSKYRKTINNVLIMCDTETSKKSLSSTKLQKSKLPSGHTARENHVVAWTISIRAYHHNIVTLWGHKPSTMIDTMKKIHDAMNGEKTLMYFHNMPYDHWFLRRFMYDKWGKPQKQLNVKPHYPLYIYFNNGIEIRDSLMLAGKKLEKWADDLQVEHRKAVGKWDYDKIRTQQEVYNADELLYIENDTLAGVECLDKTIELYNKHLYSLPYTMAGFIRDDVRNIGKAHNAKDLFNKIAPTYEQYIKLTKVFHGGFTHANRFMIDELVTDLVQCYDFTSAYPFCMLVYKYPMEKFHHTDDCDIDYILSSPSYGFIFKLIGYRVELKDHNHIMPALQYSKCEKCINPVIDNGRILQADYVEIWLNEIDLEVINEQYKFEGHLCVEVECAYKDYLPRWFTDYVFKLFKVKCELSLTDDEINYMIQKGMINGCFGMCVQKSLKDVIVEVYEDDADHISGDYHILPTEDPEKEYQKYLDKRNNILLYQHGVWITSYAFRNLHTLNKCVSEDGMLLYNDTDSGYAYGWDEEKVKAYNENCIKLLQANGYDSVEVGGKTFTLGIMEHKPLKDDYSEFKVQGAKRYAGRNMKDGEIHITVAGVPKKGAKCLKDDLNNFTKNMIFKGEETGKKQHIYFSSDIYIDENGNETADSIDLCPADYKLDSTEKYDMEYIFSDEVEVISYEDN